MCNIPCYVQTSSLLYRIQFHKLQVVFLMYIDAFLFNYVSKQKFSGLSY